MTKKFFNLQADVEPYYEAYRTFSKLLDESPIQVSKKPYVFQALLHSGFAHFSGVHFKPLDRFSLSVEK